METSPAKKDQHSSPDLSSASHSTETESSAPRERVAPERDGKSGNSAHEKMDLDKWGEDKKGSLGDSADRKRKFADTSESDESRGRRPLERDRNRDEPLRGSREDRFRDWDRDRDRDWDRDRDFDRDRSDWGRDGADVEPNRDWDRDPGRDRPGREGRDFDRGGRGERGRSRSPPYKRRRDPSYSPERRRSPERDRFGRDYRPTSDSRDKGKSSHSSSRRASSRKEDDLEEFKTYKQFLLTQDDSITPAEAAKKYEVYKEDYRKKQARAFFKARKEEEWFKEKYNPDHLEKKRLKMVDVAKTNAKTFAHEHEQGKIDYTLDHQVTEKEGAKAATEGSNASANKEGEQLEEGETNEMMNDDVPAHKEEGESASEGGGSVHEGEGGVSGAGGEGGDSEKPAGKDKDASSGDEKGSGDSAPRLISTKPANPRKLDRLDVPLERSASSTSAAVVSSTKKSTEAAENTLFIKSVPSTTTRAELKEVFDKVEGFVKLILSDPMKLKRFKRSGWAIYDNPDSCRIALHKFNGYRMKGFDLQLSFNKRPIGGGTNKESADKSKLKITPMGADNDEVITKDLDLSTQLLKLLDSEREIETHPLFAQGLTEGETERERLNKNIIYLRKVHLFCYYCAAQFEDEEEMERQCGVKHLRGVKQPDAKLTEQTSKETNQWVANLHSKIEERLKADIHSPDVYTGKKLLKEKMDELHGKYIAQEDKTKFRCVYSKCNKLFCASEFVQKHIRLKHADLVSSAKQKAMEDQYWDNYISGPDRLQPDLPSESSSSDRGSSPHSSERHHSSRSERDRGSSSGSGSGGGGSGGRRRESGGGSGGGGGGGGSGGSGIPPYGPPPAMMRAMRGGWGGMMDPYAAGMMGAWGGRRGGGGGRMGGGGRRSFPPHMGMPMMGHPSMHHMGGRGPILPPLSHGGAPPPGFVPDPRQLKTYVDLDAPSDDMQVIDYRTSVDYGDIASSSGGPSSSASTTTTSSSSSPPPDTSDNTV